MIKTVRVISAQATEILLWQKLGDLRAWSAFLADNRRSEPKQDVGGYTLLPCARMFEGRKKPPMYSLREVAQFILNIRACTTGTNPGLVKPMTLNIDDALSWNENMFDHAGKPVVLAPVVVTRKRKSGVYAGAGAGYGAGARKPTISTRRSSGLSAPRLTH